MLERFFRSALRTAKLMFKKLVNSSWIVLLIITLPLYAAAFDLSEFDSQVLRVVERLNLDVGTDASMAQVYAKLMLNEYGTSQVDVHWAVDEGISWGRIVTLSYFQATTGRSFTERTTDGAHLDTSAYATHLEMSPNKMISALKSFVKLAESERNSMIFDRFRNAPRIQSIPDLGSGFGLFQESLDFRRLESQRPVKIHASKGSLTKGDQ